MGGGGRDAGGPNAEEGEGDEQDEDEDDEDQDRDADENKNKNKRQSTKDKRQDFYSSPAGERVNLARLPGPGSALRLSGVELLFVDAEQ